MLLAMVLTMTLFHRRMVQKEILKEKKLTGPY